MFKGHAVFFVHAHADPVNETVDRVRPAPGIPIDSLSTRLICNSIPVCWVRLCRGCKSGECRQGGSEKSAHRSVFLGLRGYPARNIALETSDTLYRSNDKQVCKISVY